MGRQAAVSQWWQSCLGLYNSELSLYRRAALVQFTSPNTDARFSNLSARTCSENLKSSYYFQIFLLHYTKSCTMNEIDGILKKTISAKIQFYGFDLLALNIFFSSGSDKKQPSFKGQIFKKSCFLMLGISSWNAERRRMEKISWNFTPRGNCQNTDFPGIAVTD